MGSFGAIGYSLAQGIKNIRRNKLFSIASMATMAACILLFGVLYFMMANVSYILQEAETNVGVTVFFRKGITDDEITEIGERIQQVDGFKSYEYLSAADTWEKYKDEYMNEELAGTFGDDNPLSDSMSYTVYFDSVDKELKAVESIKLIAGVRQVNDSQEIITTLTKINSALKIATIVIVALLLGIAVFLISTTVTMGVTVRRREISIMHLIGATDFFIRGPFIVEGLLISAVGVCVPLSVLYAIYYKIIAAIATRFSGLFHTVNFVSIEKVFSFITPVSIAMGFAVAIVGTTLTLRKQLKLIRSL